MPVLTQDWSSLILLVFVLTNLGMMFGTWVAGFRIIKALI